MLALWHLCSGRPDRRLPAGDPGAARRRPARPLPRSAASRWSATTLARRAVDQGGRHPGQHAVGRARLAARRPGGLRRSSPRPTATAHHPGDGLHELLAKYARGHPDRRVGGLRPPALSVATTWPAAPSTPVHLRPVAHRGGQGARPACCWSISIPASARAATTGTALIGNAKRSAAPTGLRRCRRLQNVVRRVADQWRPRVAEESFEIVRQRLFTAPGRPGSRADQRHRPEVRRDVPPAPRRISPRGTRQRLRGPDQAAPTRSTPSCSTASTRTGRPWSVSNAPVACCG